MTLVVLAVVAAVVLAVLFRGRPSTFGRPSVQRFGLLGVVVIGLSTSPLAKSTGVHAGWLVAAALAMVWFTAVNRGRPGLSLVIGGLALNAIVIIVNAGMPVSLAAVERAGVPLSRVPLDTDPLREELTTETVLPWLGEAVPLALPIRPAVVSPGDVLVAAGGALFLFTGLTGFGRTVPERTLSRAERSAVRAARKARRAAGLDAAPGSAAPAPAIFTESADARWWEREQPSGELPTTEQPFGEPVVEEESTATSPMADQATVESPTVEAPTVDERAGEALDTARAGAPVVATSIGPSDNGAGPPAVEDPAVVAARAAASEATRLKKLERQARKRKRKRAARLAAAAAAASDQTGSADQTESADATDDADRSDVAHTGVTSSEPSGSRVNP